MTPEPDHSEAPVDEANLLPAHPCLGREIIWTALAILVVMGITAFQLRQQGRLWGCACGELRVWGNAWSSHNSQHLVDPYSFTHVLHGLIFYGLLATFLPRQSLYPRLGLAAAIEAVWEIVENTEFVIQRYRTATMSFDYQGDTVVNSLGDILCCIAGFALARRLGFWGSLALFLAIELVLIILIKDSLLLNIVMLLYPLDAVKAWQLGS